MRTKKIAGFFILTALLSGCGMGPGVQIAENVDKEEPAIGAILPNEYAPEFSSKFSSPWPTNVSREELVNSSLHNAFKYFDLKKSDHCEISANIYVGAPTLKEHEPLLRQLTDGMINVFCEHLGRDFYVLGGSYDFVESTIKTKKLPEKFFKGCQKPKNEWASACAYSDVAWIGISLGAKRFNESFVEDRRVNIAAHEIFHLVHDQIDQGPDGQVPPRDQEFFRPMWLIEGGGEYFGRLMPYYFGIVKSYAGFSPTDRSGQFLSKDYLGDLQLMEVGRNAAFGTENYYSGQIALEYITASLGMESLLNIWVEMGKGSSFDSAFFKSTGLKTEEFYEKFRIMHSNLYSGDLVTN
jgi:hypothetical protein